MTSDVRATLHPITRFIATGAYLGYAPIAPGSVGALGCAVLLWFLLPEAVPDPSPRATLLAVLGVMTFVAMSIWAAERAERVFGHDASRIVIDEFAGMLIAVLFLQKTLIIYAAAFVLFRILDILKPFPAGRAEALPGGLGIVADDLVAGIYANVLLRLMLMVAGGF